MSRKDPWRIWKESCCDVISPVSFLTAGFEAVFNRYLHLDPEVMPKLVALSGKVVAVELRGMNVTFFMQPNPQGVSLLLDYDGTADVTVRATPGALIRLTRGFSGVDPELEIEGNTEVGEAFQGMLSAIDIDWEEQLSHLLGDTAARQAGNFVRASLAWGEQALDTLLRDTVEYLQQESRDLPPRGSVERFLDDIDDLRSDLDRLEARIQRLRRSRSRSAGS